MQQKLFYLIIFLHFFSFSQNKIISISGKVSAVGIPSSTTLVELHHNNITRKALTNEKGYYNFLKLDNIENAELVFINMGFKTIIKKIDKIELLNQIDVNFTEKVINQLEEVIIKQEQIKNTSAKLIYKVNQKDFVTNSNATSIFKFVPTLSSSENSDGEPAITVDGKLSATIFIDGVEVIKGEIQNLAVNSVDKVEVISNPSGKYGSDFTGAIVNIITKKSTDQYLKGSLSSTGYLINKNWVVSPFIAYKRGPLTIKSNYTYRANNGIVDYESKRTDQTGFFIQSSQNNSTGNQQNLSNSIKLDLSKKSTLVVKNSLFSYQFNANATGFTNDNGTFLNYSNKGVSGNKIWDNSIVYNYKITEKKAFYVKGNYDYTSNYNRNTFLYSNNSNNFYDVTSNLNTYSFDLDYEAEEISFLEKYCSFYTDLKFIQRDFNFNNINYNLKQQIFDYNLEIDTEWSDNFSTEIAFTLENTKNYNSQYKKNNNYFLPTINLLYKFENNTDLKFGYSRKILRPGASDLNDAINIINPGVAIQGNSNLQAQLRDYYSINLSKTIKSNYFGLKFYTENINNSIVSVYRNDGIYLIQTFDNAAKFFAWGMNASIKTKLFKKIDANFNSGFDYNFFEDNSENALIKSNKGITYRGSLYLSTKVFKDKVSLSMNVNQIGTSYSLLSKRIINPNIYFSANATLIKDKLNASFSAGNLLGRWASGFDDVSSSNTFSQQISTRNNSTNFGFGLTYFFGKKFNDNIQDNGIKNDDLR